MKLLCKRNSFRGAVSVSAHTNRSSSYGPTSSKKVLKAVVKCGHVPRGFEGRLAMIRSVPFGGAIDFGGKYRLDFKRTLRVVRGGNKGIKDSRIAVYFRRLRPTRLRVDFRNLGISGGIMIRG